MEESSVLVLEILRQDMGLKMGIYEQQELASTLRHYSQCAVDFREIDDLCREVTSLLNKSDKFGVISPDILKALKKACQLLWDHLFTRNIKENLKSNKGASLILSLDEELIHIPWELLYDGTDFLCLAFNLGRVVRTREQVASVQYRAASSTPKMLILANPTNDLKSAYQEGLFIRNQFDKKRREIGIDFKSTSIDTLYIKKNLRDYDLVHFAGHCEYDNHEPKNSGWVLADGKFTVQDILTMSLTVPLPSLIFSNACQSARAEFNLVDSDYQEKSFNLASAFLSAGVRHYLGAMRKIEDSLSLEFARQFYTNLISGRPMGDCVRLAREKLIKESGEGNIVWASYLLYGDPNFILFKGKAKPLSAQKKRGVFIKKFIRRIAVSVAAIFLGVCLYMWLPSINPGTYFLLDKSHKLFISGKNQAVIANMRRLIAREPAFLPAYPLLGDTLHRLGRKEEALKYYFDYALYSEKRNNKKNLAAAYIGIGWIYHLEAQYPKAFDFYEKALLLSRQNNDKPDEADVLGKMAVWYMDKEDNDKALELLTKSAEINRERQHFYKHRYNLACDYFNLGLLFSNKNDFATAREFYAKSFKLFTRMHLVYELSDYYYNLGEICLFERRYQQALDYYQQGLKIDQQHGNLPSLAADYNMLGELYAAMDNFIDAQSSFQQAIAICSSINAEPELAGACQNLGMLYKKRHQKNKAREYLRRAQEIYSRIDTSDYQKIKGELLTMDSP